MKDKITLLFPVLFAVLLSAMTADGASSESIVTSDGISSVELINATPASRVDEATYNVTYRLIYDEANGEVPRYMILISDDEKVRTFWKVESNGYDFVASNVPNGRYDLLAVFFSPEKGCVIVTKDGALIDSDCEFVFDTSTAINHIECRPILPDGQPMLLGNEPGNADRIDNMQKFNSAVQIYHRIWGNVYNSSIDQINFGDDDGNTQLADVWITPTDAFSTNITVIGLTLDEVSPVIMNLTPIGNANQTIKNEVTDYHIYNVKFAADENIECSDDETLFDSASLALSVTLDLTPNRFDTGGICWNWTGLSDSNSPHHYMVCNSDYDHKGLADMFSPMKWTAYKNFNNGLYYEDLILGVICPPITRMSDLTLNHVNMGSHQIACNDVMTNPMSIVADEKNEFNGIQYYCYYHPILSWSFREDYVWANDCPIWTPVVYPTLNQLYYDFVGRGGEIRTNDWLNHSLEIKVNDKTVCDSFWELRKYKMPEFRNWYFQCDEADISKPIDIHVVNQNQYVDDTYPICGDYFMHIERDNGSGAVPAINALQFRNADGLLTDRFSPGEVSSIMIAAAGFNWLSLPSEVSQLEDLKVEYSPYGRGEYKELKAAVDEEVGLMPTYGWLWRANLADMDADSPQGWYDVRLTATAPGGSYMTQVISPAFLIGDPAKLDIVDLNREDGVVVCGRDIVAPDGSEVYTVGGRRSGLSNLASGVYVVRTPDGRATKVVIR